MTNDVRLEFNRIFPSIHNILTMNNFVPSPSATLRLSLDCHSEYISNYDFNVIIKIESTLDTYGRPLILVKVFSVHDLHNLLIVLQDAYDCYLYFSCNKDENRAQNWKNDPRLYPQLTYIQPTQQIQNQPAIQQQLIAPQSHPQIPPQNHNQYPAQQPHFALQLAPHIPPQNYPLPAIPQTWMTQPPFSQIPLPTENLALLLNQNQQPYRLNLSALIPKFLVQRMAGHLNLKHHMPESTSILVGLGVISGLTCRQWNCAFEDGNTVPICLYVVAEQDSATGKSAVLKAFQKPFVDIIEEYLNKMDGIISIEQQKLELHKEKEIDLEKEDRCRFKIEAKQLKEKLEESKLKQKKAKSMMPITDSTPQALEESLNDTKGFFIAISDEQALLDSAISGQGNKSNQVLLKGRYAEVVKVKRNSRDGYDGHIIGNFVCFSQSGSIKKVINASGSTGLFERFLIIEEPAEILIDHTAKIPDALDLLAEYAQKFEFIKSLIEKPLTYKDLVTLKISVSGWKAIKEFKNELEKLILPNQEFSHDILKRMAKKVDYQIMSIASNLHILEPHQLPLPLDDEHFIEDRFVFNAIEIVSSLLGSTRDYLVRIGVIENKDQLRAVIDYFIDKDGNYKPMKTNTHSIAQKKVFKEIKNPENLVRSIINYLISTNNLILYADGTHGLNPMTQL